MKYQYFISSRWRNRDQVLNLVSKLRNKRKTVFCFMEGKDSYSSKDDPEKVMKKFESIENWRKNKKVKQIFKTDMQGLKDSKTIVVLLPGGKSTHIEAGVAYGLGKKLILIGEQKETESLYLIFDEVYKSYEEFLKSVK